MMWISASHAAVEEPIAITFRFPILNTAMLGPLGGQLLLEFSKEGMWMMEATPMYIGFPKVQNVTYPTGGTSIMDMDGRHNTKVELEAEWQRTKGSQISVGRVG